MKLSELMAERGISSMDLAETTGINQFYINKFMDGTRVPKGPQIAAMSKALGVTVDELMGTEKASGFTLADLLEAIGENVCGERIEFVSDDWEKPTAVFDTDSPFLNPFKGYTIGNVEAMDKDLYRVSFKGRE